MQQDYEDEALRLGHRDNMVVAAWWNAPTVEHVQKMMEVTVPIHDASKGMGFINLVYGGTPKFPQPVREGLVELTKKTESNSVGGAHAVIVDGLVGAAVRTFLGTLFLMARSREPQKVFGDIPSLSEWMAPRLSAPGEFSWTPAELTELLETFGER